MSLIIRTFSFMAYCKESFFPPLSSSSSTQLEVIYVRKRNFCYAEMVNELWLKNLGLQLSSVQKKNACGFKRIAIGLYHTSFIFVELVYIVDSLPI